MYVLRNLQAVLGERKVARSPHAMLCARAGKEIEKVVFRDIRAQCLASLDALGREDFAQTCYGNVNSE